MKHIVSFSGGKDSTGMLLKMVDEKMPIDEIIFIDSSVEFPAIYKHIEDVGNYIGRDITTIRANHSYEYYLGTHVKRNGRVGYGHPDFRNQWCTQLLKKNVIKKYLHNKYEGMEVTEYHGIAYDEIERTKKNNEKVIRYPLVEFKMTEKNALQYSYDRGFDFGGLYKDFARVSCFCCPMKRIGELRTLYNKYPDLWKRLHDMDKKSWRSFRPDKTLKQLENRFENEKNQKSLFSE